MGRHDAKSKEVVSRREAHLAVSREWKAKNKERVREMRASYYKKHKEKENTQSLLWKLCNHEKVLDLQTRYRERHREDLRLRQATSAARDKRNSRERARYRTDREYAVSKVLRAGLLQALRLGGATKTNSVMSMLGLAIPEFMDYIATKFTSGMSWENHGEWHLDHIRPCASFDLNVPSQVAQCFHYTNYQPLWASVNISKGAKWLSTD